MGWPCNDRPRFSPSLGACPTSRLDPRIGSYLSPRHGRHPNPRLTETAPRYRNPESPEPGWDSERAYWESRSPIVRFGRYLQSKGLWSAQREEELRKAARREAIRVLNEAEQVGKPHWEHLFTDVYDTMPWMLQQQRDGLAAHMERHAPHYEALQGVRP